MFQGIIGGLPSMAGEKIPWIKSHGVWLSGVPLEWAWKSDFRLVYAEFQGESSDVSAQYPWSVEEAFLQGYTNLHRPCGNGG